MSISERLYEKVMLPASLLAAPVLCCRSRGRARIQERYGSWQLDFPEMLWFHGASVGEMNGLVPVLQKLREREQPLPILATATSVTGLGLAAPLTHAQRLLPLDHPCWIRRALSSTSVRGFVFAETELWPCLINHLAQRSTPMFLVNARISDYTFSRYYRLRSLVGPALRKLRRIMASSELAATRFMELGALSSAVVVAGNAKYDRWPSVDAEEERVSLRQHYLGNGSSGPVLVLGSLRPGEEAVWFPVLREVLPLFPSLRVLVAPRHREKFAMFEAALGTNRICYVRSSRLADQQTHQVVLIDEMGKLEPAYSFADAAFIGGTLQDYGGHNPLEAAAYGACVVMGPYTSNVRDIVAALREQDGYVEIRNADEARQFVQQLCTDPVAIREKGARGRAVWRLNMGAAERIIAALDESGVFGG